MASAKRVKQDGGAKGGASAADAALQAVIKLHEDIMTINKEHSREAEKLELAFSKKRSVVYDKRTTAVTGIPGFWITAVRVFLLYPSFSPSLL